MADGRGGYQKPSKPAAVSGPGKFSQRTDGGAGQPIREPDIDSPDLQYGDRGRLTEAQRIAKAASGQGARVSTPRRMSGQPGTGAKLPPWFSQSGDPNPQEPTTAGLSMGEGPGPEALQASAPADDVREVVLDFLAQTYGNQDVIQMLAQLRQERSSRTSMQAPMPAAPVLGNGLPDEPDVPGAPDEPEQ